MVADKPTTDISGTAQSKTIVCCLQVSEKSSLGYLFCLFSHAIHKQSVSKHFSCDNQMDEFFRAQRRRPTSAATLTVWALAPGWR